ncbi:MAG: hypothetical protein ACP5Q1_09255 [Anaerolineae bacterium]
MRRDARAEGLRWLEQAEADRRGAPDGYYVPARYPNSLPDSIPARVYNRAAAEEALRLADQVLQLVRMKLCQQDM